MRRRPRAKAGGVAGQMKGFRRTLPSAPLLWVLVAGLLLCALAPDEARARPERRFHLGIGLAGTQVAGDLDGTQTYSIDPTNGPVVWAGQPDDGRGVHLTGGVALNRYVAIEAHLISTRHETTHEQLPDEHPSAAIVSFLAAGRFMLPLGDSFETFARLGLGGVTVEYQENAELQPNPTRLNSQLSGGAWMTGVGMATFFDPVGVELGVMWEGANLRNVSSVDKSVDIPAVRLNLTTVTLTATVHFGGPPPNPESAFPPDERPPPPPGEAGGGPSTPGEPTTPGGPGDQ